MSRRVVPNAPAVVAEIIDGEAVIMNLELGHYFSTRGTGALVWDALERGHGEPEIAAALGAVYEAPPAAVADAVTAFVDDLLAHGLLRAAAGEPSVGPLVLQAHAAGGGWEAPTLAVYTDMEDLLLLDPIHDVGAAGWPMPLGEPAP